MQWPALLVLVGGCDWALGLKEVSRDAASHDVQADDANLFGVVDVTPGGGPTTRYDLSTGPIVLDFKSSCASSTYAIVPRATFSVSAKIWGAGGGGGYAAAAGVTTTGGGGGYAAAKI